MSLSILIAIVSSLAGTFLSYKLTAAHEKHALRLHKLESLIVLISEFEQWLSDECQAALAGEEGSLRVSTIHTINTIVSIYFPEMHSEAFELAQTAQHYQTWKRDVAHTILVAPHAMPASLETADADGAHRRHLLAKMTDIKDTMAQKSARIMQSLLKYA